MKFVASLIIAAVPFAFQTHAVAQTAQTTTSASATTQIAAEFTRKIDAKDARVGDDILARTIADATLADGTPLPRGTRLTGSVTEVRAQSGEAKYSHLAITFNRAIVPDGHDIPLHATLRSMAAPAPLGGLASPPDTYSTVPGSLGGPAPATGRVSSGRGRGAPTAPNSVGGLPGTTVGGLDAGTAAAIPSNRPVGQNDPRAEGASATGDYVHDALQLHRYPVANMPGVILSSQVTANISGALDASGRNIRLENGTRMTMDVSTVAR
jgi:hypothetical protein